MYISSALAQVKYSIYADFVYLQTPYWVNLLGFILGFFDEYYFLISRLVIWSFSFAAVCIVFASARSITQNANIALCFAAIFAASSVMWPAFGTVRNDAMSCFFAVATLALILCNFAQPRLADLRWIAAGVTAGLAVGTKASYVFLPIGICAVLALSAVLRGGVDRARREFLLFVLGGMITALPILYYAARSWDQFFWMNATYHTDGAVAWFMKNDAAHLLEPGTRIRAIKNFLNKDAFLSLSGFILFLVVLAKYSGCLRQFFQSVRANNGAIVFGLLLLAPIFSFFANPAHVHYVQPVIPVILFCGVVCYAAAGGVAQLRNIRAPAIVALGLLAILPRVSGIAKDIYFGWRDEPMFSSIHKTSLEIRNLLDIHGGVGKVASISPVRVADSGIPIYKEFSAGSFFFRSSEQLSPAFVKSMGGVSKNTLQDLFAADPPLAILTGFEDSWKFPPDAALDVYAIENGYMKMGGSFGGGRLYVRPKTNPP